MLKLKILTEHSSQGMDLKKGFKDITPLIMRLEDKNMREHSLYNKQLLEAYFHLIDNEKWHNAYSCDDNQCQSFLA